MNKQIALQRTRMYAAFRESHPIYFGDPIKFYGYGGPAWGEKNGSSGGFIGAALGIGAAIFTGGASLGFTTLASTLATVSLIGSVVGAVTGNKAFSQIGMIAGLGSAFMSLSSAGKLGDDLQGWAKSTEKGFTNIATNISSTAAPVEMSPASTGAPTVDASQAGSVVGTPTELNLSKDTNAGVADTAMPGSMSGSSSMTNTATDLADTAMPGSMSGSSSMQRVDPLSQASNPAIDIATAGEPINAMQASAQQGGTLAQVKAAGTGINTGTSLFDRISTFAKDTGEFFNKNPAAVSAIGHGVGAAYQSPATKDKLASDVRLNDATTAYRNEQIAQAQQQTANANAQANVNGAQFNPNVQVYNPKPTVIAAGVRPAGHYQGGLIQQPRSA